MKKFLISLLLMLPLILPAQAQQKIGIVNTTAIMEALPDVKAATTKIQDLAKQYDAEIKRMQDELKAKLEAYQKEEATMTEVIKTRRQQALQEMEARLQHSSQMMQAQGCAYILESSALLATGSSALDLTQAVKDALGIKAGATTTAAPKATTGKK